MHCNKSFGALVRVLYVLTALLFGGQGGAGAQTISNIKQQAVVNFPRGGELQIQVVAANDSSRVVFKSRKTGKRVIPLSSAGRAGHASQLKVSATEVIYFSTGDLRGVPSPVVFIATTYRGADHCGYTVRVVGEVGGSLRFLTNKPFETDDMGGVHVGDLGAGQGEGVAVWRFIWGPTEAHFDEHQYKFELYGYDARKHAFAKVTTMKSNRTYVRGEDAAAELRLPYKNFLPACAELFRDDDTFHLRRGGN